VALRLRRLFKPGSRRVDPFGGAKPYYLWRGKEALLRVNPEPLGFTRGLELVERHAQALMPGESKG